MVTKKQRMLATIVLIGLVLFFVIPSYTGSIGFNTAYQGFQIEANSVNYNGVYWGLNNEKPTPSSPSSMSFGYTMDFDPDSKDSGMPDLMFEQQPMTAIKGEPDSWQILVASDGAADTYEQFTMYEYDCEWAINIWSSGGEGETIWEQFPARGAGWTGFGYDYGGTKLWLRFVPSSFVYIEGNIDNVFFAPAYIGMDQDPVYGTVLQNGKRVKGNDDPEALRDGMAMVDVTPGSIGASPGFYYTRGANDIGDPSSITEAQVKSYEGKRLDANIFRDEYWMRIDLPTFKTLNWYT